MGAATAVAIGSAVVGAAGAVSNSRSASRAASSQQRATDQQVALGRDQLAFGREQYQDWRNMFMPVLGDLREMAAEEQRPDFAGIASDVQQSFDASQGINRRQMERFGIAPTDGASNASETQYGIGRALAQVGAFNQARQGARDSQFNRMLQIGNLSAGQQAMATNTMNGGFGSLMGAFGNQANLFGAQANNYMQAAAAGAQMAGYGMNQLAGIWGNGGGAQPGGFSPVPPPRNGQIWPGGG